MSGQASVDYARFLVEHGNTVVGISLVRELLEHIAAQDEALAAVRRATLLEAADAIDAEDQDVDWEESTPAAGRRHAAEQLQEMAEEESP